MGTLTIVLTERQVASLRQALDYTLDDLSIVDAEDDLVFADVKDVRAMLQPAS